MRLKIILSDISSVKKLITFSRYYSYETSDGLREDVVGEQKEVEGGRGTAVQGSYEYIHNGIHYTITYTADEHGFQAHGDHLPRPVEPLPVPDVPAVPEIPVAVLNSLPYPPLRALAASHLSVDKANHEDGEVGVEVTNHGSSILRLENVLTPEGSFQYGYNRFSCLYNSNITIHLIIFVWLQFRNQRRPP